MSSRKYLIRRENCRFIGPLTPQEFRLSLRKMQFGLQDEVAGHCGPWVVLEDESNIKKTYPELASIIAQEVPAAWRDAAKQAPAKDKLAKPAQERKRHRRSSSPSHPRGRQTQREPIRKVNILTICSIAVACAVLSVAVWMKMQEEPLPAVSTIASLAQQADPTEFLNEMGLQLVPIVKFVAKGKDKDSVWLPYLRMYAFHTSGAIEMLPMKILRSNAPAASPADCSVEAWKKRWNESSAQTNLLVGGKSFAKTTWSKALIWDPSWIRRRAAKGWVKPRNWLEGCLMSASVAIRAASTDQGSPSTSPSSDISANVAPNPMEVIAAVARRLQSQLELIQVGRSTAALNPANPLAQLSCLDLAQSAPELEVCRGKYTDQNLQAALDDYYNWQALRIAIQQPSGVIDPVLQPAVGAIAGKASESQNHLDTAAEIQFAKDLVQSGFKVDGLVERINQQHPEVRLRP